MKLRKLQYQGRKQIQCTDKRGIFLRIKYRPVEHLKPSPISTCHVKHFEVFNALARFWYQSWVRRDFKSVNYDV